MKLLPHWLVEKLKASFPFQIAMDRGQSQRKRKRVEEESTEGASPSSSTSREATDVGSGQYDVFLSFRGSDTRKEFTDHLYRRLLKAGFCVFKDDKSIPIGEEFGSQILDAIARTKISIPIISENYASSKWCLRELIHMMDCKKSASHIVLPIFYKVIPSDVRHLKGNFGNVFKSSRKHFDEKDIQKGPSAFSEVSYLNGWESAKFADGHEGELIEHVVKTVISKLEEDFQLDVPKQLVGVDGLVEEILNWMDSPSINARMIGIYGMGGIGKTTLAKCIYNLSKKFMCVSFLPDVRETAKRQGITYLQSQLVSDILQSEIQVSRIDDGINIIKSRFKSLPALIILDDVDDKNQLDALVRDRNWFMKESIIIVTTRNEAILDQSELEVDYKYELNGLDKVNALLLFNRHAFRRDHSLRDFEDISHDIISTMGGLPLALQVVGSYLYKKTDRQVWEDVRKQLKNQPHRDVQKILQISYDALEDGQKQIFLDIVCFFVGEVAEYAMHMWEDCGLYPSQAIKELKLRCLIRVNDDGEFIMHDQLRDLGRSIFCHGQLLDKRSGPWDNNYKGPSRVVRKIKGPWFNDWLRAASSEDSNELLSEVRWLQWSIQGSDLSHWTTNLDLPNLSVLDLWSSEMTEDWEGWSSIKALNRLRVLDISFCHGLRCAPDLSALPRLKFLDFYNCSQLEHLHPSIGKLKSLVFLDLCFCEHLKELPEAMGELKELEELILDYTGIIEIPPSIGSLQKLKRLTATCCKSLRGIPTSIGDLQNLQHLDMSSSKIQKLPSSMGTLKNLHTLKITHTPISDMPKTICNLSSLKCLSLLGCVKLHSLKFPSGLTSLSISCQSPRLPQLSSLIHLEELHLHACHLLEDIPELALRLLKFSVEECHKLTLLKPDRCKYLEELSIKKCSSIETLELLQLIHLNRLQVEHCNNLVEIQGLDKLEFLEDVCIDRCNSIERLVLSESRCFKRLQAIECNNLLEVRGLDGLEFSKQHVYGILCRVWQCKGS